ncbi:MAG: FecR family protein [Campylobacterota bacterium]|nr:FecR family protein [Campylobacterota bacterium]
MRVLFLLFLTLVSLLADIGVVGAFKGSAELIRQGESHALLSGSVLQENDAIITQEDAKVQLIMKDETIITIGPNSHFELDSYIFEDNAQSTLNLRLQRGFFRAITGKIGKLAPERFKIRTKSATIGIRGTDFAAYVDTQSEYIGCFNGAIHIQGEDESFDINADMMVTLINGKWEALPLNIVKFYPLLVSNTKEKTAHNNLKPPFDASVIDALIQQERFQNESFEITPGYELETSPPPFIP